MIRGGVLLRSTDKICYIFFVNNKPIMISSMLAAGIFQDTFVGEAVEGRGEEETTGGYFYCYFYWYFTARLESLPFLSS